MMLAAAPAQQQLVDVRLFSNRVPGQLVDISRDGRLVSFAAYVRRGRYDLGVIDLPRARIRVLVHGASSLGALSPNGRMLLFDRGGRLDAASTTTGRTVRVAWVRARVQAWLSDGRVELVDRRNRVFVVPPGRQPRLVAALPRGALDPSLSPDGRRALYAQGCRVRLLDLATGRKTVVTRRVWFDAGAWSPDGRHFLLQMGSWDGHCRAFEQGAMGGVSVRDLRGRELEETIGWGTWSADGRLVLVYGGTTGTAVTYLQELRAIPLRAPREIPLVDRAADVALAGPGGWILYARYDATTTRPDEAPLVPVRLYLGRLARR